MNEEDYPHEHLSEAATLRLEVMRQCHKVPEGRVMSYGQLGASCNPPISGYICGRVMGTVMEKAPWWRIVGKDGKLPISKRGPLHSEEQHKRLVAEGVDFDDQGRVLSRFFVDAVDEAKETGQGSLF